MTHLLCWVLLTLWGGASQAKSFQTVVVLKIEDSATLNAPKINFYRLELDTSEERLELIQSAERALGVAESISQIVFRSLEEMDDDAPREQWHFFGATDLQQKVSSKGANQFLASYISYGKQRLRYQFLWINGSTRQYYYW